MRPRPTLSDADVAHGLRMMTWEGVVSMALFSVTTNGLLVGFALAIGANNLQIGIMAAIPFLTQLVQVPSIPLVERFRRRKAICLLSWAPAQVTWVLMALIPFAFRVPNQAAVGMLLGLLAARGLLGAVTTCAWNSWVRDLVPQSVLGSFFSRRLALSALATVGFALAGAFLVDVWQDRTSGPDQVLGYSWVLLGGALVFGVASPCFIARMPEPLMGTPLGPQPSLLDTIRMPLRDRNFRQLTNFLFLWGFAANLAIPFFTVFMLQRLGFSLSAVIGLNVVSQLLNVAFLRVWGPLADRFGSKAVLSLSASLYALVILGWTFTTAPDKYFLTIPLVIVLQVFAGVAAAGVNLTVGTIGLKLAPQDRATAYMTAASLATSLGAGLGPLAGGIFADFFSVRQFSLTAEWLSPARAMEFSPIHLTGFDFLFFIAFIIGLITLNTLTTIREEGEAGREEVLEELLAPSREMTRMMASVPGMYFISALPYSYLRRLPGMDVAVGVTAYQLASSTRGAVAAVTHSGEIATSVARQVRQAVAHAVEGAGQLSEYGRDIARHATRGAMHAIDEAAADVGNLSRGAMLGSLRAFRDSEINDLDAIWGASYGIVQGAGETGSDIGEAAAQAVRGAREAAEAVGLSPERAADHASWGALAAAEAMGQEPAGQVREALAALGLAYQWLAGDHEKEEDNPFGIG